MMRQKLALVVRGSPDLALRRMNGFSPVRTTRLGSAAMGHLLLLAHTLARTPGAAILAIEGERACTAIAIWTPRWRRGCSVRKRRGHFAPSSPGGRRRR